MSDFEVLDLGRMPYGEALSVQQQLVEQRKQSLVCDRLLFVEHPPVITMGRNGHMENLLASEAVLRNQGIEFHHTNRGGDVTYHGPGQIVGYPIFDLKEWKRDVVAYVRAVEAAIIDALSDFRIDAGRVAGATGVWTSQGKIAAIGVHISRWVTYHGFALNVDTNLDHFGYIIPCGLTKPVTSMAALGLRVAHNDVKSALVRGFRRQFASEAAAAASKIRTLEPAV